jgi:hypothetical protein
VQAYARDRVTSVTWTDREVKAFTQVGVEPGEWVEVMILVLAGDCTVVVARDAASSDRVSSISCSAAAHASRTSAPPPSLRGASATASSGRARQRGDARCV